MDSNLFWCIIGIIGGAIFSLLISLLFYYVGLKRKRLTYNIKTFCIISNKINQINGLEVKYNSNVIDNLYSSTITIKNIGNSIIEKQDFAPLCPLSVLTNGKFLVDESNGINLFPLNKANNVYPLFEINEDNGACNRFVIAFDYISKKEELTCSIFHTGEISVKGELKDGKFLNEEDTIANVKSKMRFLFAFLAFLLSLISSILTLFFSNGATRSF